MLLRVGMKGAMCQRFTNTFTFIHNLFCFIRKENIGKAFPQIIYC